MGKTSIEWTRGEDGSEGRTWNPIGGCSVVSPGCHNCYARNIAARFSGPGQAYRGLAVMTEHGPQWTGEMRLITKHLSDPLRWRDPSRVFVNSTSDLFHEGLMNEEIAAVFGVMAAAPQHTFQVLTKRAKRMREWFGWLESERARVPDGIPPEMIDPTPISGLMRIAERTLPGQWPGRFNASAQPWPLPNVHLGVSVEDQKRADERILELIKTPAAVRFLSVEPQLGLVEIDRWVAIHRHWLTVDSIPGPGGGCPPWPKHAWAHQALVWAGYKPPIDWVIVGGESGPDARPFDLQWAHNMVAQCKAASIPCFVKQLGAKPYDSASTIEATLGGVVSRVQCPNRCAGGKELLSGGTRESPSLGIITLGNALSLKSRKGGDMAEWPESLRVREFPETRVGVTPSKV